MQAWVQWQRSPGQRAPLMRRSWQSAGRRRSRRYHGLAAAVRVGPWRGHPLLATSPPLRCGASMDRRACGCPWPSWRGTATACTTSPGRRPSAARVRACAAGAAQRGGARHACRRPPPLPDHLIATASRDGVVGLWRLQPESATDAAGSGVGAAVLASSAPPPPPAFRTRRLPGASCDVECIAAFAETPGLPVWR